MAARSISNRSRAAFTLVELLVVIAIIAVLIGLLIPAVQRARDSAARASCLNNLHQFGIAFQNYEQDYGVLPPGNRYPWYRYFGNSWCLYMLPYLEQHDLYDQYNFTYIEQGSPYNNPNNTQLLNGVKIPVFQCPASPTPRWGSRGGPDEYLMTDYAGVSGSVIAPDVYQDDTFYPNVVKSFGGVLQDVVYDQLKGFGGTQGHAYHISGTQISFGEIPDGLSNTLILVEQSDYCRDASGNLYDCRAATGDKMFTMGMCCADWAGMETVHLTTVLHPVGFKSYAGLGIPSPNSPIQSVHIGGANVLFVDGSARFLMQGLDITQLYHLADRDDGESAYDGT